MRFIEYILIDNFSTPSIFKTLTNVDYKGFVHNKLNKIINVDLCLVEQICKCFRLKKEKKTRR